MKCHLQEALAALFPALLSIVALAPLAFLAGGSLMGSLELWELLGPVLSGKEGYASWRLLPRYPTLRPLVELLLDSPAFFVMLWNSVKITALTLLGQLVVSVPAAWWFARSPSKLAQPLFSLYIILMLMPFQVTMVSNYLVLDRASLLDSWWSVILPAIFSAFPVFLLYRFFREIPQAMLEAAEIDGAGSLQAFLYIGVPLGKAGVASAMVLGFLDCWNLIEQPMTFLTTKSLWPLSLFLPQIGGEKAGLAFVASLITLIPSLAVFFLGQEYLEQGIISSAIKE